MESLHLSPADEWLEHGLGRHQRRGSSLEPKGFTGKLPHKSLIEILLCRVLLKYTKVSYTLGVIMYFLGVVFFFAFVELSCIHRLGQRIPHIAPGLAWTWSRGFIPQRNQTKENAGLYETNEDEKKTSEKPPNEDVFWKESVFRSYIHH